MYNLFYITERLWLVDNGTESEVILPKKKKRRKFAAQTRHRVLEAPVD